MHEITRFEPAKSIIRSTFPFPMSCVEERKKSKSLGDVHEICPSITTDSESEWPLHFKSSEPKFIEEVVEILLDGQDLDITDESTSNETQNSQSICESPQSPKYVKRTPFMNIENKEQMTGECENRGNMEMDVYNAKLRNFSLKSFLLLGEHKSSTNILKFSKLGAISQHFQSHKPKKPRIGKRFQCEIPTLEHLDIYNTQSKDKETWNPFVLPENEVTEYIKEARRIIWKMGVKYIEDYCLQILAECQYNRKDACIYLSETASKLPNREIPLVQSEEPKNLLNSPQIPSKQAILEAIQRNHRRKPKRKINKIMKKKYNQRKYDDDQIDTWITSPMFPSFKSNNLYFA